MKKSDRQGTNELADRGRAHGEHNRNAAGLDPSRYFSDNYETLGVDPVAYGWFQLYMVISVCDEPAKSFQQIMDGLPSVRYTDK